MTSDFLRIDLLRLDKEWLEQPERYFVFAKKLARARRDMDGARSCLDLVAAELDSKIRAKPKRYGLENVTEAAIKALIPAQAEHRQASQELAEAKYKVDLMQAAVTALDHRKRALSDLVTLHGQNYFSSPNLTNNKKLRELVSDSKAKEANSRTIGTRKRLMEKLEDDAN